MKKNFLITVYACIALLAFIGCMSENAHYLSFGVNGLSRFIEDLQVTHASKSFSIDLALYFLAGSIWIILEGKRLALKHAWLYVLGGLVIAISVTFPLFLIHRELFLHRRS